MIRDEYEIARFRIIKDGTGDALGIIFSCYDDEMYIKAAFDHAFGRGESQLKGTYTLQRQVGNDWVDTEYKKECLIKD